MIFPTLKLESIIQTDDKTRLDGTDSYITVDEAAITLVEIEPEAGAGFIDVTGKSYLDYQYSTEGTKTVTIRITTDGGPTGFSKDIEAISPANDKLFSYDSDLISHEPNVLEYVRAGRNSFIDVHRLSQSIILAWLDENRIWDISGNRLTKDAIIDIEEVRQWSKYLTLRLIFEGLSNATDDIFHEKAIGYRFLEEKARNRGAIRLDIDGSGEIDGDEKVDVRSYRLVRR